MEDLSQDLVVLECKHCVDLECMKKWALSKSICPVCRAPAPERSWQLLRGGKITVRERVVEVLDAPLHKEPLLQELDELENLEPLIGRALPKVQGSWGTKITAMLTDIQKCFGRAEPARIVVFSQFGEMLPVLQKALVQNDMGGALCWGKSNALLMKAVEKFKQRARNEKNVILLLPISKGAEGLTLIEANILMLMEPSYPAALEQQAVARIHRIGQKHAKTYVYRYIVLRTVEQRIAEIGADERRSHLGCGGEHQSATGLSADVIDSILLAPEVRFDVASFRRSLQPDVGGDTDVEEEWWLEPVMYLNSRQTRRDVFELLLETFKKEDAPTVVLNGAEVPTELAQIVENLKSLKMN